MKFVHNTTGLLLAALIVPVSVLAECKELKIIEYENTVEAVCVGEPLTEAQRSAIRAEEKRQEEENTRQKALEERRQKEAEASDAKAKSQAEVEQKKQATKPVQSQPSTNRNKINLQKF